MTIRTTRRTRAPSGGAGARALTVEAVDDRSQEWDRFVREAEDGTFCHLWGWREIMDDVQGGRTLYLAARDRDGALEGVLPLVEIRSPITGSYLVSMPFLNYGGPVGSPGACTLLATAARDRARRRNVDLLELRTRNRVEGSLDPSHRKITVLLDLPPDPEVLWRDRFPSKLRSQVRRPMKEGMEVRSGAGELGAFYDVFSRHMRDLGTPVLSRAFFERIAERLADHVVFTNVYRKGRPVAGGCGFLWRDEFEITWASALREFSRSAPNMLLYWSMMEAMIRSGVSVFNFGRCTPGSGTHRFKSQWGGRDVPLPWMTWSPGDVTAPPTPDRPIYRIAAAAWSRLPLALANRMGPFFSRRLP